MIGLIENKIRAIIVDAVADYLETSTPSSSDTRVLFSLLKPGLLLSRKPSVSILDVRDRLIRFKVSGPISLFDGLDPIWMTITAYASWNVSIHTNALMIRDFQIMSDGIQFSREDVLVHDAGLLEPKLPGIASWH